MSVKTIKDGIILKKKIEYNIKASHADNSGRIPIYLKPNKSIPF